MINSKDISVIVQGAIDKEITLQSLKRVRKFLPNAEIVLSTWEGTDVSDLEGLYDILLLNKDPGPGYYYNNEKGVKYNNMNRQLVSSREGLKKATRTYALKIRSDIVLNSRKFLKYFDLYPKRDKQYSLFKHKILGSVNCTRFVFNDYTGKDEFSEIKMLFHVSDFWFFGLKEDLELYFNVPLATEPEFSSYYLAEENKEKLNPYKYLCESYLQFSAEQYFAIKCFEQYFKDVKIEHAGDINDEKFEKSRKYLINNFIFIEYNESGIYSKKHLVSKYTNLSTTYIDLYNRFRQQYEYKKYCDNEYKISKFAEFFSNDEPFKKWGRKLYIHFHKVHRSKNILVILRELFITVILFYMCMLRFIITTVTKNV